MVLLQKWSRKQDEEEEQEEHLFKLISIDDTVSAKKGNYLPFWCSSSNHHQDEERQQRRARPRNNILQMLSYILLLWISILVSYYYYDAAGEHKLRTLRQIIAEKEIFNSESTVMKECPAAILQAKGLYSSSSKNKNEAEFLNNVVLLTSSNRAYYDVLQSWESYASKLGYEWAVLAMDRWIEDKYNNNNDDLSISEDSSSNDTTNTTTATTLPNRVVGSHPAFWIGDGKRYLSHGYNELGCNKWRAILSIMERCEVDIIYSDVNNLFLRDPFSSIADEDSEPQFSLEQLLSSNDNAYDFVYSAPYGGEEMCSLNPDGQFPASREEGNTGFFYIRHGNKKLMDSIRQTLLVCSETQFQLNEQSIFWNVVNNNKDRSSRNDQDWHHCSSSSDINGISNPDKNDAPRFCCMDPTYHRSSGRYQNNQQEILDNIMSPPKNLKTLHIDGSLRKQNDIIQQLQLQQEVRTEENEEEAVTKKEEVEEDKQEQTKAEEMLPPPGEQSITQEIDMLEAVIKVAAELKSSNSTTNNDKEENTQPYQEVGEDEAITALARKLVHHMK